MYATVHLHPTGLLVGVLSDPVGNHTNALMLPAEPERQHPWQLRGHLPD
jgi:hypothetical protein